jgi:hypothetical protein
MNNEKGQCKRKGGERSLFLYGTNADSMPLQGPDWDVLLIQRAA